MWIGTAIVKNTIEFFKNIKLELQHDPAILLLGIYLKKMKTWIQKDTGTLTFIAALHTSKTLKQSKCPSVNEWIKKCYIYNGILLSHRKEWKFSIYSNMDGPGGYYA